MTILPINFYQTYTSQVRGLICNLVISFYFFLSSHNAIFLLFPCVSTFSSLAFKSPITTIIIISSFSSLLCRINTSSPSTSFFFLMLLSLCWSCCVCCCCRCCCCLLLHLQHREAAIAGQEASSFFFLGQTLNPFSSAAVISPKPWAVDSHKQIGEKNEKSTLGWMRIRQ